MELDPITYLRRRARRLVVADPDENGVRVVYAITHVHTPDLAGLPALDVIQAKAAAQELAEAATRLRGCRSEEERQQIERELAEAKARFEREAVQELFGTLERMTLTIERAQAMVMLSVEAMGTALPEVPTGTCEPDTLPEKVCRLMTLNQGTPREERVHLRPVKIVAGRATGEGQLSVLDFKDRELTRLAMRFSAAFSVAARVTPLSGATGDPALGRSAGDSLRGPAEPVPSDRGPLAGGRDRHSGDADRPRG